MVSQVLAACALLTTIFPMNTGEAVLLSLALMTVYVVFGGAWGAGMGGIVKMVLLYAAGMLGLILVLSQGGVGALLDHVKAVVLDAGVGAGSGITNEGAFWHRFTHLFARGVLQDAGVPVCRCCWGYYPHRPTPKRSGPPAATTPPGRGRCSAPF